MDDYDDFDDDDDDDEGYCFLININVDPPGACPPRIPCIKRMIFQKMLFLSRQNDECQIETFCCRSGVCRESLCGKQNFALDASCIFFKNPFL